MSLIALAIYSTEENKKDDCLAKTLESLWRTVDLNRHRIMVSINGFTDETMRVLNNYSTIIQHVVSNNENIGTARAINKLWALRRPGEHCVKHDDDVLHHTVGWADMLEEAIERDARIGQCAAKRKDCWEHPDHKEDDFKSYLYMLPHIAGEKWIIAEKVKHCIGTCVMHSAALINKCGGLYQPSLYGYDDVLYSWRSSIEGFYNCFLPNIEIDHIDEGKTPYQSWKEKHSGEVTQQVIQIVHDMINRKKSTYFPFE